jgi:3-phosphoshikimate 1-carboxyvinyltransferase
MNITIGKPIQGGTIQAIASKSMAHRLLICAALAQGDTLVLCQNRSEDIDATADCLRALGARIAYKNDGFLVSPMAGVETDKPVVLNCGESGSTLRFLLPVCGALGVHALFHMKGRLPQRPLTGLREAMEAHGCKLTHPEPTVLSCEGKLTSGLYRVPGDISSQFVSGLLFALPLLDGHSQIHVEGLLASQPYADMTLDALALFGISAMDDYGIAGAQAYRSPGEARVEGDWSNAAFWLCAGAIGASSVTCTRLNPASKQGDRAVVDLLRRFGARITVEGDAATVLPAVLNGIDIDAQDTPDLVPVLAAVAAVAQGTTIIRNAQRLRIKESDRLRTTTEALNCLGANVTEAPDGLIIHGKKRLAGGQADSHGDHRIAMMAAVVSAACTGPVVIRNAQAVNKSYPGFFEDFAALGGELCQTHSEAN